MICCKILCPLDLISRQFSTYSHHCQYVRANIVCSMRRTTLRATCWLLTNCCQATSALICADLRIRCTTFLVFACTTFLTAICSSHVLKPLDSWRWRSIMAAPEAFALISCCRRARASHIANATQRVSLSHFCSTLRAFTLSTRASAVWQLQVSNPLLSVLDKRRPLACNIFAQNSRSLAEYSRQLSKLCARLRLPRRRSALFHKMTHKQKRSNLLLS